MALPEAIESVGFLAALRESELAYPIVMTIHLTCIAIFGGMILMTDLRLLGVALKSYSIADVVNGLRVWKRIGGVLMITAGLLLGACRLTKYAGNPYFWIKMTLLGTVLVSGAMLRKGVYAHPESLDSSSVPPTRAKVAAVLSLALWTGVLSMGRWIAYYDAPRGNAPQSGQSPLSPIRIQSRVPPSQRSTTGRETKSRQA